MNIQAESSLWVGISFIIITYNIHFIFYIFSVHIRLLQYYIFNLSYLMSICLYSNNNESQLILSYLYDNLQNVDGIYIDFNKQSVRDYNYRGIKQYLHLIIPVDGVYELEGIKLDIHNYIVNGEIAVVKNKEQFYPIKEILLTAENNDMIKKFIENAINMKHKQIENSSTISVGKIKKKIYTKYGWMNHSSVPKRNLDTIFLKEGQMQKIQDKLMEFTDKTTYNDYIKHGIPYKYNIILHGVPGVGKTSVIHAIASMCNANICMLNINEELKENDMIDAIRSVHDDDNLAVIVIEDIDCIFSDRKSLDSHKNHITLNGLLNCLDGFNNQEGVILIMTTNYPDKLDEALLRSGRIDLDIELSHLDRFQAKNMFLSFFNNEKQFDNLWEMIKKYNVEPSTLLQFLFTKRKSEDISDHFDEFVKLLYKKSQKTCNMYI